MTGSDQSEERQRFIEDMALLYERAGHTRMQGRIMGWLMVCDLPSQTAGEIAAALQASKASISTNIRMFVAAGLIERFTRPPDRRDHYRLPSNAWPRALEHNFPLIEAYRDLAVRGLTFAGEAPAARERLEEMRDFYDFYQRGLRELLDRWTRGERVR